MYNVSNAFKEKMKQPAQRRRLRGTFGDIPFGQKNVLENTFNITNQCSGEADIQIGQVYVGELKATFRNLNLLRTNFKNKEIIAYQGLEVSEGQYEDVKLGHYYVDSAEWSAEGVSIVAYDNMAKFDKKLLLTSSQGRIFDFVTFACRACGVTCEMQAEDFSILPNGSETFTIYSENDMETYRDLISWCAQTLGSNALIDREGHLIFKQYKQDSDDIFTELQRLEGGKFSDFITYYTGISMVNIADKTTSYYGAEIDDGLTMNLGQNPLIQYGLSEVLERQRRAILNSIVNINYTPTTINLNTPLVFDLMDVLTLSGGLVGEEDVKICITKYTWTYNGQYTIECAGSNPALANARSKVDKDISGLMSQMKEDSMHYYDYKNVTSIHIADGQKANIIFFRYITARATHIDFHAEVKYRLETTETIDIVDTEENVTEQDAILKITYILNDEELNEYYPLETVVTEGTHLLHLLYTWRSSANIIGNWSVQLEVIGGSIDIDIACSRAYIAGQGLVGDEAWDGTINLEDEVPLIIVPSLIYFDFADEVLASKPTLRNIALNDNIPFTNVNTIVVKQFTDSITDMKRLHRFDVVHNANEMSVVDIMTLNNKWKLIDGATTGSLTTPNCTGTNTILQITSEHSGDDVAYIVSFDNGVTWWTYQNGWIEPDYTQEVYGMFELIMRNITTAQWAEKLEGSIMVKAILTGEATVTDIQIYTEDLL